MSTIKTNSKKPFGSSAVSHVESAQGKRIENSRQFFTNSAQQTKMFAKNFAQELLKNAGHTQAIVLALQGDLGSGKTTFVQGLAGGLGVKEKITSPTFVILKRFKITNLKPKIENLKLESKNLNLLRFECFYHFDCYRIIKPEEILELGWQEIINNPQNIVAVEWPERIKKFLPKQTHFLKFEFINETQRSVIVR